jgi:hypothetical protein
VDVSWGRLREHVFASPTEWPSAWTHMERRKFLAPDHSQVLRFEGLGKYGEAAFDRALRLADAGFGPPVLGREDGFTKYAWVEGTASQAEDLDEMMVERIAQYCAFRAAEFTSNGSTRDAVDLETMTRVNLLEEFGSDEAAVDLSPLSSGRKIITDSRMMPHAWLRANDRTRRKADGSLHGDDHFFPGPCDVAWDLAGAIIEWEMGECVAHHLLALYSRVTGDDARPRIQAFLTAYAAFRMGYCKMAAEAMRGNEEELRLQQDYLRYREILASRSKRPELAKAA